MDSLIPGGVSAEPGKWRKRFWLRAGERSSKSATCAPEVEEVHTLNLCLELLQEKTEVSKTKWTNLVINHAGRDRLQAKHGQVWQGGQHNGTVRVDPTLEPMFHVVNHFATVSVALCAKSRHGSKIQGRTIGAHLGPCAVWLGRGAHGHDWRFGGGVCRHVIFAA